MIKRAIISWVLAFGLVLGIGSVSFTNGLQESEDVIKVPGATEDFVLDYSFDNEKDKQGWDLGNDFSVLIGTVFFDSVFDKKGTEWEKLGHQIDPEQGCQGPSACPVKGVTSERRAVIIGELGVIIYGGEFVESDLALVYYTDELQEKIEYRKSHPHPDFKNEYRAKHKGQMLLLEMMHFREEILLLIPEAEEAVQKFVDSFKDKV